MTRYGKGIYVSQSEHIHKTAKPNKGVEKKREKKENLPARGVVLLGRHSSRHRGGSRRVLQGILDMLPLKSFRNRC